MPLPLRVVEPVHVSRGTLPDRIRVRNELEAAANGTLANVIRQLSMLSHNAEEIFSDLIRVGSDIANRAGNLQARIDRLAVKVVQMDGLQEECTSMHDSLNTKPFQSSMIFDQQVCARHTIPPGMAKIYQVCDRPPPLDKLNQLRDDGKDGLKFYTDPSYFFELWRQDMLKDTERAMYDKVKKPHKPKNEHGARHKKRVRQPHSTRERQRHVAIEHGEHIMTGLHTAMRDTPDGMYSPEMMQHQQQRQNARPNSIEFKYQNDPTCNNDVDYRHQQQQMQPNHYETYNNQQSHLNHQRYYPMTVNSPPPPYESPAAYARASTPRSNNSVNHTAGSNGFRPSQQPPPPPNSAVYGTPPSSHSGTPTRSMRALNIRGDRELLPPPPPVPAPLLDHSVMSDQANETRYHNGNNYPEPLDPVLPPPSSFLMMDDDDDELPIPPPPPAALLDHQYDHGMDLPKHIRAPFRSEENLPSYPLDTTGNHQNRYPQQSQIIPPPPPLPQNEAQQNGKVITKEKRVIPPPVPDTRSELLKAIREGINLKKVDEKKISGSKEDKATALCDVASILARRVAVEMSDSDDSSDYDSEGWDETSA